MGAMDVFSAEDRVEVKFSDFYRLMKEATKAELMMNAVNCDVPRRYIRETMTGELELLPQHTPEKCANECEAEEGDEQ